MKFNNLGCNTELEYHLDDYNCTDFAIQVVNSIGLNVPTTSGTWSNGGGRNPGDLGEDLRDLILSPNMTRNDIGGLAESRNCD